MSIYNKMVDECNELIKNGVKPELAEKQIRDKYNYPLQPQTKIKL